MFNGAKMKIAIIGSRSLKIENLGDYLPDRVTEIVSGGAKGIDTIAAEYSRQNNIKLTEFLPDYARYKKGAPLKRNQQIADYADEVIAFWDGISRGTKSTIAMFEKSGKNVTVINLKYLHTKKTDTN